MQYCCAGCQRWIELDDANAWGASEQRCPCCDTPVRVASGLLTQIASERVMQDKYDLAGAHVWPPEAQVYLEGLRREAFKPKPAAGDVLARWAGPLLCLGFLLAFGIVAQLYLGRPTAYAANSNQPFESQSVIAPALIPENPAVPHDAGLDPRPSAPRLPGDGHQRQPSTGR
jgi:hypothetical protein